MAAPPATEEGASGSAAQAHALPEVQAPAHWQAIDFMSDLHLCAALPRTYAAFERHLRSTTADAVFILGDLFELWVGDDMAQHGFEAQCTQLLRQVSQRTTLAFMVGNRDFLAGPAWRHAAGVQHLADPVVLQAFGQRVLLSHGDAWCLADEPYQAFRREVRSAAWQKQFLSQSLAERTRIAGAIRAASNERQRFDGALHADVDRTVALRWLHQAQATVLVHGHTHRPASEPLDVHCVRHVLSDWELDQGQRAEVLRLSAQGLERLPVAID
jgi:UDP-2,3-diacylglucosamine hydrolase